MRVINYPRYRARGFVIFGLAACLFVASFFWTASVAKYYTSSGLVHHAVAILLFVGNMIVTSGFVIRWNLRYRRRNNEDYQRIGKMRKVLYKEIDWLHDNCNHAHFTLHQLGLRPTRWYVEFHNDQERLLFNIAFPR